MRDTGQEPHVLAPRIEGSNRGHREGCNGT